MTTTTPRAGVPLLAAAQAQKHVTHNEALLKLDALLCARILDRDLSAPPASPADGDAYLVKATGSGVWTGQDGAIAYAVDGGWRFYAPFEGLCAFIADESVMLVYSGAAWVDWASVLNLQNIPLVGVNTTADATNKLAAKSSALLFDNIGNGVQVKVNKHAVADTASFLYQTNYSGRAEIGLAGDDSFHFKVSPDGSGWTDALVLDKTTGAAALASSLVVGGGSKEGQLTVHSAAPPSGYMAMFSNGMDTNLAVFVSDAGAATKYSGIGPTVPAPLLFYTAAAERMRIDAAGKVGIGTAYPGAQLEVKGAGTSNQISVTNTTTGYGVDIAGSATGGLVNIRNATGTSIVTLDGRAANNSYFATGGNLGLGATSFGASAANVLGIGNGTAPGSSPAGMGQLYVEAGALKYRGSGGTVTVLAPA